MESNKRIKLDMKQVCTHSGSFHADESLAVYMLRLLPEWKDSKLVRSRDPAVWEESDIVIDVGGKYDGVKFFDHHQRGFEEVFGNGFVTKLSSAGLVYKHFGKEIISEITGVTKTQDLELLYKKVYGEFVELLDANDNGINNYDASVEPKFKDKCITLPRLVAQLNPRWNEGSADSDYDRQFALASQLMGTSFVNYVEGLGKGWLPAKSIVSDSFAARFDIDPSGEIVELSQFCPWKEHLYNVEKNNKKEGVTKFVIFADSSGKYRVSTVSVTSTLFEFRKGLPERLRGLRDDELSKESGIDQCIFVHASGFIGGTHTREGALALAKLGLAE